MKRFIALALALIVGLSFVGCSSDGSSINRKTDESVYFGEFKITHLDMVGASQGGISTACFASLVNDDVVLVARIDKIVYAQLAEGDIVSGEIAIAENNAITPYAFKFDNHSDWFKVADLLWTNN